MSLYSQGHEHLSNDLFSCTGTISSLGSASAAFVTPTITETVTRTTTMTPTSGQESISHSYTMPPVSFNTFGKLTVTPSQMAGLIDPDAHWPILFPLVLSPVLAIWALSLTTWEQQSDRLLIRKIMIPSAISFLCFGGTLGISFHGTASSPPSAWASVILNSVAVGCMTVAICGWKRFATMGPACGKLSLRQTAKARTPYTPQGKHTRETSQTTLAPPRELKPQPEPKLEGKTARQLSSSRLFPTARQVLACVSVVEQRQIDRLPQRDRVAAYEKVISRHLLHHTQRHGTDWEACSDAAVKAPLATPPPPMARASKETPPPYGMVPKPHGNQPPFPSYGMNLASEAGENPMLYSIMLKPEAKAPLVTPSPPQARGLIGDREPRVIASLTRPVATRQEVAPENIPLPPESPAERSYQTSPRGPLTLKNYPSTRSSGRSPSPEIATPPQTTTDLDWEVDDLVQQTISELDLDVYRSETSSPKLIDYEQERRDQEAWEEAEEEDCRRWEEGDTEASRLLDNWDYLLESHPETLQ